jgi:hypothetical protein
MGPYGAHHTSAKHPKFSSQVIPLGRRVQSLRILLRATEQRSFARTAKENFSSGESKSSENKYFQYSLLLPGPYGAHRLRSLLFNVRAPKVPGVVLLLSGTEINPTPSRGKFLSY